MEKQTEKPERFKIEYSTDIEEEFNEMIKLIDKFTNNGNKQKQTD